MTFFVHNTARESCIQVTILVCSWCQAISSKSNISVSIVISKCPVTVFWQCTISGLTHHVLHIIILLMVWEFNHHIPTVWNLTHYILTHGLRFCRRRWGPGHQCTVPQWCFVRPQCMCPGCRIHLQSEYKLAQALVCSQGSFRVWARPMREGVT